MSQLGRIGGQVLTDNLLRAGVDLAFETDLLYLDVTNNRIGIRDSTPIYDLDVNSNIRTNDLTVTNQAALGNLRINVPNTISTSVGGIAVFINGGGEIFHDRVTTNNLVFDGNLISSVSNSNIVLDPNGSGTVQLLSDTNITGDLVVSGNISMSGNLTGLGTLTFGDQTIDTVTINTDFTQSIIPGDDVTYAMGADAGDSSQRRWAEIHAPQWQYITDGAWPGSGIVPLSATISDQVTIDGVLNKISAIQSNEDILLSPDTDITDIESLKFYRDIIYGIVSSGQMLSAPATARTLRGIFFKSDGTVAFSYNSRNVVSYPLSTPWDISSIGNHTTFSIQDLNPITVGGMGTLNNMGPYFKYDGTKFWVTGNGGGFLNFNVFVFEYSLSSPWDITTASHINKVNIGVGALSQPWFNSDGTKFYEINWNTAVSQISFQVYNCVTAWTIVGMTGLTTHTFSLPAGYYAKGQAFSDDGTAFWAIISDGSNTFIRNYTLGTAWDVTTMTFVIDYPSSLSYTEGIYQRAATTDLYLHTSNTISKFTLDTPDTSNQYIQNLSNTALTVAGTGTGYYLFAGNNGMVIPAGTSGQRPSTPEVGDTRWNITEQYLECFDGTVYVVATGGGDLVTQEFMEDLGFIYSAILG
jgi:hypothetical protein